MGEGGVSLPPVPLPLSFLSVAPSPSESRTASRPSPSLPPTFLPPAPPAAAAPTHQSPGPGPSGNDPGSQPSPQSTPSLRCRTRATGQLLDRVPSSAPNYAAHNRNTAGAATGRPRPGRTCAAAARWTTVWGSSSSARPAPYRPPQIPARELRVAGPPVSNQCAGLLLRCAGAVGQARPGPACGGTAARAPHSRVTSLAQGYRARTCEIRGARHDSCRMSRTAPLNFQKSHPL